MVFDKCVFPQRMDSQIARLQLEGVLRKQSVPPLLPAYNKCMGGVDRGAHIRKTYGFDRKPKPFFQICDNATDKPTNCRTYGTRPNDLFAFRLELVHQLME